MHSEILSGENNKNRPASKTRICGFRPARRCGCIPNTMSLLLPGDDTSSLSLRESFVIQAALQKGHELANIFFTRLNGNQQLCADYWWHIIIKKEKGEKKSFEIRTA